MTIARQDGEMWRDALVRSLPSAARIADDALGSITDDERAACLSAFDALVASGMDEREAVIVATFRAYFPALVQ